jgi:hypothetical protein
LSVLSPRQLTSVKPKDGLHRSRRWWYRIPRRTRYIPLPSTVSPKLSGVRAERPEATSRSFDREIARTFHQLRKRPCRERARPSSREYRRRLGEWVRHGELTPELGEASSEWRVIRAKAVSWEGPRSRVAASARSVASAEPECGSDKFGAGRIRQDNPQRPARRLVFRSLQLGVFCLGLPEDRNIAVRVFPEREEILVGSLCLGLISR